MLMMKKDSEFCPSCGHETKYHNLEEYKNPLCTFLNISSCRTCYCDYYYEFSFINHFPSYPSSRFLALSLIYPWKEILHG